MPLLPSWYLLIVLKFGIQHYLPDDELRVWIESAIESLGLKFDPDSQAIALFLSYVQGHLGDVIALARRIWLDCRISCSLNGSREEGTIQAHHVHRSALALAEDLSLTYESLILLLPPSQVWVFGSNTVSANAVLIGR